MSVLDRAFLTHQPSTSQVLMVRHGQQRWPSGPNVAQSDWVDPPLSEVGYRQAKALGEHLANEVVGAVLCSGLSRARETARFVASPHGLEPEVYGDLREIEVYRDLPDGTRVRDVIKDPVMRGVQERFVQERRWDVFPYTEPAAEFRNRVVTLIEGAIATHEGESIVVVCHGGVINAWIGHVLGVDEDMFFRPGHASLSRVLCKNERRVVHSLNEVHHLSAVDGSLVTY